MRTGDVAMERRGMDKKSIAAIIILIGVALIATAYL